MKSPLFYTVESARIIADIEDFGNVLELIIVIPEDNLATEELEEALAVEHEHLHDIPEAEDVEEDDIYEAMI